jgi:hypothetical protein
VVFTPSVYMPLFEGSRPIGGITGPKLSKKSYLQHIYLV